MKFPLRPVPTKHRGCRPGRDEFSSTSTAPWFIDRHGFIEEELSVSHRHPAVSRAVEAVQRLEAIAPGLSAPMMRGTPGMSLSDSVSERLLRERIILLGSEVRDTNANEITSQLLLLAAEDPEKDITLYINSPGGSVTAGMAIYDTMMWIEPDVATTAMGLAASMGQFLLTAGAKGKRAALPHTRILMHQPSAGVGGTAADIAIQAEMLTKSKRELTELQALHTGQSIERIEIDQDRDRWFTAQEALEYGFIDKVVARAADNTGGAAALATDGDPDKPSLKK
jgi:ATP-dependent Clp protease protease subunit